MSLTTAPNSVVLSHEEELMKYAQTLEWKYKVKTPKPLYAEATEARRQSMARNARKILTYSITPPAPGPKGSSRQGKAGPGALFRSLSKSIFNPHEDIFAFIAPTPGRPQFGGRNPRKSDLEEEYSMG